MTRAEKFRRGGLISWAIGAFFSGSLLYSLSPVKGWIAFGVCVLLAVGIQYTLTTVESILIYGEIPHPFHKDSTVAHKWVWAIAFACLAIDAYINFSGIAYLLNLINENNNMAPKDKDVLNGAATLLSVLLAMLPEACNAYADILDGKGKVVVNKQKDKLPFQEDQTLVKVNRDLENQNNGLRNRLKELEGQLNKNNQNNDNGRLIEDNFNIGRRKK